MKELIITTITISKFSTISKCSVDSMKIYQRLLGDGAINLETYRALLGNLFIVGEECGLTLPPICEDIQAIVAGRRNKLNLTQNEESDSQENHAL